MTIAEAEHILGIVEAALCDDSHPFGHHPISELRGYEISHILAALKLRIANEFLQLVRRSDFEQRFAEGLELYDSVPWQIIRSFVADEEIGNIGAKAVLSPIDSATMKFTDKRLASVETCSSFGNFCKTIGPEDPNYWQRVYARIGIEYDSRSPHGNSPMR